MIEKSVRTVVLHGGVDFVPTTEGTKYDFTSPMAVVPWTLGRWSVEYPFSALTFIYDAWGPDGAMSRNVTLGGLEGFRKPIAAESFSIEGFGVQRTIHQERKYPLSVDGIQIQTPTDRRFSLNAIEMHIEVDLFGHMMPLCPLLPRLALPLCQRIVFEWYFASVSRTHHGHHTSPLVSPGRGEFNSTGIGQTRYPDNFEL